MNRTLLFWIACVLLPSGKAAAQTPCDSIQVSFSLSDSVICSTECITLKILNATPGVDYTFLPPPGSMPNPNEAGLICFAQSGEYSLQLRASKVGCADTLVSKPLKVRSVKDQFPNAFTPNGDEINDVFKPVFTCPVIVSSFAVYNRWGQKVFETPNPGEGWDGSYKGDPAPADVYGWRVEYDAIRDDRRQKLVEKGDVTLLR